LFVAADASDSDGNDHSPSDSGFDLSSAAAEEARRNARNRRRVFGSQIVGNHDDDTVSLDQAATGAGNSSVRLGRSMKLE
jgi:hypothetical protein